MAVFIKKVNIPQKSDLINIDMTGSGTAQTYRIIKVLGNDVVEVVSIWDTERKQGGANNTYENSALDTYLNTTWYNTLNETAKEAIVDKTFTQMSMKPSGASTGYVIKNIGGSVTKVGDTQTYGNSITRHVYALSVQDIIDYVEATPEMTADNTTLTTVNILQMLYNNPSYYGDESWFSTASGYNTTFFCSTSYYDGISSIMTSNVARCKPAFQIDLSKIDYTFTDGRQPVELKPVSILQKSNNTLSRVGMSYKVPIDLTGTTWLFNNRIDVSPDAYYDINFTSGNEQFARISTNGIQLRYIVVGVTAQMVYQSNTWQSEAYRTIQITGGTDATNQDLVAWLQANATQQ